MQDVDAGVRLALEVEGTVAVVAPRDRLAALQESLAGAFGHRVGFGAEGLSSDITVLSAQEAKGLEFDSVVVVDPVAIVDESERGAAALYVAMTRPTQRLVFAEANTLPLGL